MHPEFPSHVTHVGDHEIVDRPDFLGGGAAVAGEFLHLGFHLRGGVVLALHQAPPPGGELVPVPVGGDLHEGTELGDVRHVVLPDDPREVLHTPGAEDQVLAERLDHGFGGAVLLVEVQAAFLPGDDVQP